MPPTAAAAISAPSARVEIHPLAKHRRATHPTSALAAVPGSGDPREIAPPPSVRDVSRLLTGVVEVLDGRRPTGQLMDVLPLGNLRALLRTGRPVEPGTGTLRSTHLCRTDARVVDVCARVEYSRRSRAMAGRLEFQAGRWRFTYLALI